MINKNRIIELMNEKNITAYKLWKLSGVAQSTISDILNKNDRNVTSKTMQKIAEALEVSIDELFKEEDNSADMISKTENSQVNKIPNTFVDPFAARSFVKMFTIFGSEGFNTDKFDDTEIIEFANELLKQAEMVGYKYKK